MVTSSSKDNSQSTDESVMARLLNKTNYKWDLVDPKVRDAWMLRTRQRLEDRGEDVLRAAVEGPPTPEWVMSKNDALTPRQAEKASADLMDDYHVANAEAYGILLDKIDLEKRASLANRIARHAESRDGHAVWLIVAEACDFSTGAKQDAIAEQYDKYTLSSATPKPEKLKDDLHDLHALWLKLSDETKDFNGIGKPDQPSTALQKAVQILFGSIIGESFNFGLDEGAHVEWMKKYGFDIVDHLTHTQMDKKWNSIHGKTFFENANVPRLIKVELPKKSRLSFGR